MLLCLETSKRATRPGRHMASLRSRDLVFVSGSYSALDSVAVFRYVKQLEVKIICCHQLNKRFVCPACASWLRFTGNHGDQGGSVNVEILMQMSVLSNLYLEI